MELIWDEDEDTFLITSANIMFKGGESSNSVYQRECGLMADASVDETIGGGNYSTGILNKDIYVLRDELPTAFEYAEDKPGYYEFESRVLESKSKAMIYSTQSETRKNCFGEGISTPWPTSGSSSLVYESGIMYPDPNNMPLLKMSDDKKRLTASGEANFERDGKIIPVKFEADFSRN
jgi:hypothetical protein